MGIKLNSSSFVHLHIHSQYSLLEATCQAEDLAKKAAQYNMPALALTDLGNMFGAIEFYFAAREAGVKPIIGLEVYLAPFGRKVRGESIDGRKEPNRRLVLLAQNHQGYQNLCQISSIGYKEGFYYKPRIDFEVLQEWNSDIIALSGGLMGQVPWTFINKGADEAVEEIRKIKNIFPDRFYLEMCRTGQSEWQDINNFIQEISRTENVPIVAGNDVHYTEPSDKIAQEVLICIGSNKTLHDETRFRLGSDQFYFKNSEQMRSLFKDVPEACDNTLEVADRCNVHFQLSDDKGQPIYHLPTYPTNHGGGLEEEMKRLSLEGLHERFREAEARGEVTSEERKKEYYQRLEYELKVITQMGFNGYFLIVQDFINWAKQQDIPVGPGRGSGAGSLVAYSLNITDLDPMPYNLIFERFLNPERVSMPDFDIDFCQENRGRVIDYVTQKYGEESVSQIITYGKLQCRAAIRDVGRVMGMTYGEVDVVSKLVPEKLGITIKEAIDTEPRLRELMEADPKVQTLMDLAKKIEGLVRHAGIHAAGVIIADGSIVKHAPLYRGAENENVVQYDMKHAEKIGLIKFDFLGLKTLTHIHEAMRLIKLNRQKVISLKDVSLKDEGIYEIMCAGDTAGIFQFEGEGITDLIRKAQPNCFEDIVAINALYRPGPMDMIPDYLDRKKGVKKVNYAFPILETITKETYGIIVYQEQVQLIAAKIANYSLGEADMLRRAMGKKIPEVMAKQKDRFLKGAEDNNYDMNKASQLFDAMAEFAKYGFNKSHAAAYCVVAAYTAYLKYYYPVEFFAALLSTEMGDTDKVVKYVKDAQAHNIEVLSPHINYSEFKFNVKDNKIFFSLGAIKGVGKAAVEAILEARNQLPEKKFNTLEHFFEKVDLRRVNKKTIECLIKAGALDSFGSHRSELMAGFPRFIERADQAKKDREVGQASLFAMNEEVQEQQKVKLENVEPWRRAERLAFEKSVLGFYLSDHPLKGLDDLAKIWISHKIEDLEEVENKTSVQILGMITSFREIITKKGTRMAFAQLEDLTGAIELIVFPNTYSETEMNLKSEGALIVKANYEKGESGEGKLIAEEIKKLETEFLKVKKMQICLKSHMGEKLSLLKELLLKHPGNTQLQLQLDLDDIGKKVDFNLLEPQGVNANTELLEGLYQSLGDSSLIKFM